MHIDLWAPGDTILLEILQDMAMYDICDSTQFKLAEKTALYLAKMLMKHIVLTFNMVAAVVVNANRKKIKEFKAM